MHFCPQWDPGEILSWRMRRRTRRNHSRRRSSLNPNNLVKREHKRRARVSFLTRDESIHIVDEAKRPGRSWRVQVTFSGRGDGLQRHTRRFLFSSFPSRGINYSSRNARCKPRHRELVPAYDERKNEPAISRVAFPVETFFSSIIRHAWIASDFNTARVNSSLQMIQFSFDALRRKWRNSYETRVSRHLCISFDNSEYVEIIFRVLELCAHVKRTYIISIVRSRFIFQRIKSDTGTRVNVAVWFH